MGTSPVGADHEWKKIAEPVMSLYREATDGSSIETKESALVWHHQTQTLTLDHAKPRNCWIIRKMFLQMNQQLLREASILLKLSHRYEKIVIYPS